MQIRELRIKNLLLGRKAITNLDSILKSRDSILKPSWQSYGFSSSHVWIWELDRKESWAHWCFWTWYWRRPLRVPWTARRSNHSILKEIKPECSLEGLMLKLQYFGYLMQRARLIGKDTDAGKDWRQEEKGVTGMRWLDGIINLWTWVWANSGRLVKDRKA